MYQIFSLLGMGAERLGAWAAGRLPHTFQRERFLKRGGISLAFLAENWQNPFFDRIFHALTVSPRQSYR
ncbi:MAG: hypothetical protein FWE95_04470, partial [Planctomycetaceae bacterium]|nr:hypothetical protein [Planctomycetaceae bacterium]